MLNQAAAAQVQVEKPLRATQKDRGSPSASGKRPPFLMVISWRPAHPLRRVQSKGWRATGIMLGSAHRGLSS
ncbi:hypothetical protein PVAP13_6KG185712 [Panicum virgatum]|uniref:Uncharacterized protein n=1 Tax=Panicum virgatum TaxID=38727 RepID=A0A8T0R9Y5_PANVG|nr:hypothetical protein PVAP13_6KG185712 [Panicum virgatum]